MSVCDVCAETVGSGDYYCLTTQQVVTASAYWVYVVYGALRHADLTPSALSNPRVDDYIKGVVRQQCSQHTAWLVCEKCMDKFGAVEKQTAHRRWQEWVAAGLPRSWCPPDGDFGAVDSNVAREAVAAAYTRLRVL